MKASRTISVVTAAAAVGLGVTGTATAAVAPATGSTTCTTEPVWRASTTVFGTPIQNHEYTVTLPLGTFYAEWSSAWNLAVHYTVLSPGTASCKYRNTIRATEEQFHFDGYEALDASMRRELGDVGAVRSASARSGEVIAWPA